MIETRAATVRERIFIRGFKKFGNLGGLMRTEEMRCSAMEREANRGSSRGGKPPVRKE